MSKPVVFLDVDGVLRVPGQRAMRTSQEAVKAVNWLTDAADAQIVVSSVWRLAPDYRQTIAAFGITAKIIGRTPDLSSPIKGKVIWSSVTRGSEIRWWLDRHTARQFVILDDDKDMDDLMPRLIQTDPMIGLTLPLAELALKTLTL